jgi:hypothetical protein
MRRYRADIPEFWSQYAGAAISPGGEALILPAT